VSSDRSAGSRLLVRQWWMRKQLSLRRLRVEELLRYRDEMPERHRLSRISHLRPLLQKGRRMSDQLPVDASDRGRDGGSLLGLRAEKLRERLPEFVSGVAVSRSATRPRVIDRADHPARQSPKSVKALDFDESERPLAAVARSCFQAGTRIWPRLRRRS